MEKKYLNFEDLKIGGIYFCETSRQRYKVVSRYKDMLWCQLENGYSKERSTKKYALTRNDVDGNYFH